MAKTSKCANVTTVRRFLGLALLSILTVWAGVTIAPQEIPSLARLHMDGRFGLRAPNGSPVNWTGATAFQLVELVAHGRVSDADRFLKAMKPARIFRAFVMLDKGLFVLSPGDGLAALGPTLDLAARNGVYLEVVAFAGTVGFPDLNYVDVARQIGRICIAKPACAAVELGNELWPLHEGNAAIFGDLNFLKQLRSAIREAGPIPVSLGSTHADQDASDRFREGDYLTIHGARGNGDEGNWRWVRRTAEQRALGDRVGRYPVNDEPRRDDLACDKHLGLALLARMFRIGDTFHFGNGLYARPPEGAELIAFQCRSRGWTAVPDDWSGDSQNAGAANSPVKSFTNAGWVYTSVRGSDGYALVLGAQSGLSIQWSDAWPHHERILTEGAVQFYRVSR